MSKNRKEGNGQTVSAAGWVIWGTENDGGGGGKAGELS